MFEVYTHYSNIESQLPKIPQQGPPDVWQKAEMLSVAPDILVDLLVCGVIRLLDMCRPRILSKLVELIGNCAQ
jgi:hypothetical protein